MSLFSRLFGKKKEPLTIHGMTAEEIRVAACAVIGQSAIAARDEIVAMVKRDPMNWFGIRPRQYGESGGHYGVVEVTAHRNDEHLWPGWMKLIPPSQLRDTWLQMSSVIKKRTPLGGHMMDEENQRKAVCEFADHLVFKLYDAENEARGKGAKD